MFDSMDDIGSKYRVLAPTPEEARFGAYSLRFLKDGDWDQMPADIDVASRLSDAQ